LQIGGLFLWQDTSKENTGGNNGRPRNSPISRYFLPALAAFACLASLTVWMIAQRIFTPAVLWITLLALTGVLVSLNTIRIAFFERFQEIILSFLMAVLLPWFGFLLQSGEVHRFLPIITLPLLALRVAMLLSYQLSTYARQLSQKKQTLMVRIGWQNGMLLHNWLILFAFVLIAFGNVLGVPLAIGMPPMAAILLGLWQIWSMRRIAQGGKPNWSGLVWGGVALYGLVVYLYAYSFWIN
jgi:1,4-dihydroxy-2-naphthoate octaprenyltransferase